jgi:hypothetical protein
LTNGSSLCWRFGSADELIPDETFDREHGLVIDENMISMRYYHASTLHPSGKVLITGGQGPEAAETAILMPAFSVFDALQALWAAVGLYHPMYPASYLAAHDVFPPAGPVGSQGDGRVDVNDALSILRIAVELD